MKSILATTAMVLVMGGSAFAQSSDQSTTAPAATTGASMQFSAYQAGPTDVRASEFIGKRIYATEQAMAADQVVKAGAEREWDDIGEINEVLMDRQGDVKAVVLGVGGFLGIGEKNVAVPMDQVKFVKNGDGADDYFLVINANKQALTDAPAYQAMEDTASNAPATGTADTAMAPAATDTTATAAAPAAAGAATQQDMQTTASTNTGAAMDENRTRLTAPTVTREGYEAAQPTELTAEKLQGATVYGPNDESVASINRLVMNEQGQITNVVLDVGGFLGIGAREIAVTPQELNIMRNTKGDDVRVYIDANKDTLKAQPEYKASAE